MSTSILHLLANLHYHPGRERHLGQREQRPDDGLNDPGIGIHLEGAVAEGGEAVRVAPDRARLLELGLLHALHACRRGEQVSFMGGAWLVH